MEKISKRLFTREELFEKIYLKELFMFVKLISQRREYKRFSHS